MCIFEGCLPVIERHSCLYWIFYQFTVDSWRYKKSSDQIWMTDKGGRLIQQYDRHWWPAHACTKLGLLETQWCWVTPLVILCVIRICCKFFYFSALIPAFSLVWYETESCKLCYATWTLQINGLCTWCFWTIKVESSVPSLSYFTLLICNSVCCVCVLL